MRTFDLIQAFDFCTSTWKNGENSTKNVRHLKSVRTSLVIWAIALEIVYCFRKTAKGFSIHNFLLQQEHSWKLFHWIADVPLSTCSLEILEMPVSPLQIAVELATVATSVCLVNAPDFTCVFALLIPLFYAFHTSFDGIVMLIFSLWKEKEKTFCTTHEHELGLQTFSNIQFWLNQMKIFPTFNTFKVSGYHSSIAQSLSPVIFPPYSFSFSSSLIKNYHPRTEKKVNSTFSIFGELITLWESISKERRTMTILFE